MTPTGRGLLLDTHAAVWWAGGDPKLSAASSAVIADPSVDVWCSTASTWELAIKVRAGKLELDVRGLALGLTAAGVRLLGIGLDDSVAAGLLDWSHRDPFDRMLVAQAERLDLDVVTRDPQILRRLGPERTVRI